MIVSIGHFTPIGMRTPVPTSPAALVINTCSGNDTAESGDETHWTWCNPTNRAVTINYLDLVAVSPEAMWQGAKMLLGQEEPDKEILNGNWRKNKGRRPIGAYAGRGQPLITSPGQARRLIYIPSFRQLIDFWQQDAEVRRLLRFARDWSGPVYLRDHDTGRGLDRNGPMSHAWLLCVYLNTGEWPS